MVDRASCGGIAGRFTGVEWFGGKGVWSTWCLTEGCNNKTGCYLFVVGLGSWARQGYWVGCVCLGFGF